MADLSGEGRRGNVGVLILDHTRCRCWRVGGAIVATGAVAIGLLVSGCSTHHGTPTPSPSATKTSAPQSLPTSAVHDAKGLVVTLPDLRGVLGATPLPGVSLSSNNVSPTKLDGTPGTVEMNFGTVNTASQYRSLYISITRWPTPEFADRTWGKDGHSAYRENRHKWESETVPVANLGSPGLVYQMSTGPFTSDDGKTEFDHVGPVLEARYRNVVIRIHLESASFVSKAGKTKAVYESSTKTRDEVSAIARKLKSHL